MSFRTRLGVDVDSDTSGLERGLSRSGSGFQRFGRMAAQAGRLASYGLLAAGAAAGKLTEMAAEDAAAQVRLATTLRNATGARRSDIESVEEWISAQGKALGVADDDLRPAIGRLAAATGDLAEAQDLASLAMDVSAGTGKSLQQVTEALARAANGSTAGLGRLGVATRDAAGESLTLDQITAKLARTYEGQATKAANTAAGSYQRLKVQIGEQAEEIGTKLLPYVTRFGTWLLDKGIPGATRFGQTLAERLGPPLRRVGEFITGTVVPAAQRLYSWFVDKIAPGLRRTVAPIIEGMRDAWGKVSAKLSENSEELGELRGFFSRVTSFIVDRVMPAIGDLIGSKGFALLATLVGEVIDEIASLVDFFGDAYDAFVRFRDAIESWGLPGWMTSGGGLELGLNGGLLGGGNGRISTGDKLDPLGDSPLSTTPLAIPTGGVTVDARTYVDIPGVIVDPVATARALERVLEDQALREGRRFAFVGTV